MIDRQSPVPVYFQIEQYIEHLIEAEDLKEGDRIPSEKEFTEQFQVSRMTIRQAVMDLVSQGILIRLKGKGTFVSERKKIEKPLTGLNGFTQEMESRGLKPDSRLLDFKLSVPSKKIAAKLALDVGQNIFEIKRTRLADGLPMAIETSFIPSGLVPELTAEKANQSLYDYIEKECGLVIDHAEQTLEASIVTAREAKLLEVPKVSPVLLIERVSYLKSGEPFEFTKSLYRADRYKFIIRLPNA
ncbi:GntR family transcriptional regulator [Sporolactobacillus shoreae]|uniref:GntR family transcriptional regulator n=1 Tax=Sporolactobacillus shoreae TaxID=1465501 RepID=A0A4Z0GRF2_9BACL|nr:GntR family transcriptional regulator [Sporolactobacillus shoreae]TGA99755.1 GntR family transcriptional regulator [Sporolactobacillus shoreae]